MAERTKRSGSKWRPLRLAAGALLLFGLALLVVALFISATPLGEAAFGLVILGVPTMSAGGLLWWLEGVDAKAKAGDKSRRRRRRRRHAGDASRFSPSEQLSISQSELGPVTLVGFDAEADPDLDPAVPFRPSQADWTLSRPAPLSPAPMPLPPAVSLPFRRSSPVPFHSSAHTPFQTSAPAPFQTSAPAPLRASGPAPFQGSAPAPLDVVPLPAQEPTSARSPMAGPVPPLRAPATPSAPFGRSAPMPLDPLGARRDPGTSGSSAATPASPLPRRLTPVPDVDPAQDLPDSVAAPYRRATSLTRERVAAEAAAAAAALRQPAPPSARMPLPTPATDRADVPAPVDPVGNGVAPASPAAHRVPTSLVPASLATPLSQVPTLPPPVAAPQGATLRQLPPPPPLPAPVPARGTTPLSPPPRPQPWLVPPVPLAPLQLPPLAVPPLPMPMSMPPLAIAPLALPPLVLPPLVLPPLMLPPLPYPLPEGSEGAPPSHELQPEPTSWSAAMLGGLHWRRFEAVVETLYRQAGFRVRTQPHGSHGGLHIWLYSRHQVGPPVSVVRCERGHGIAVGVALLRELSGVMFAQGARRGHFVSGAGFTTEAQNYAKRHGIHLLDVPGLLALIQARSADQQHALLEAAQERP